MRKQRNLYVYGAWWCRRSLLLSIDDVQWPARQHDAGSGCMVDVKWYTVRRPTDTCTVMYVPLPSSLPTLTARRARCDEMMYMWQYNWVTKTCSSCSLSRRRTACPRDPISAPNVLWESELLFVGKVHFVEELFAQVSLLFICLSGYSQ